MRRGAWGGSALALALLLAACASPVRTTRLDTINQRSGYRYVMLDTKAPKSVDNSVVMLSFSGGGTRAAALADGVLRAMAETEVPAKPAALPLASQIDVISSVSGGSVTAAWFALGGIDGLGDLEQNFLHSDIMSVLIGRTLLNPAQLFKPRIDILESYLDDQVFHHKTYQDLIDADVPGRNRRPYVVLNAADMASGSVFSFNQDQFDLICADLSALPISAAVSASAAFPVALSALTLRNQAPCPAQQAAPGQRGKSGWETEDGQPEPVRIVDDRAVSAALGVNYPAANNLARFRRGTVALTYLNRDAKKDYIQLLDGGIADNLGLTMPFTYLTSSAELPSFFKQLNFGPLKLLFIVVNARGQADNDFGARARPPGAADTLMTAIGTPIDATSFQLLGQLDDVIDKRFQPRSLVLVDFDLIADAGCRAHFHNMVTSWTLPGADVDDLVALGKAMVLQSPAYRAYVAALGGSAPPANPTVEQLCARFKGS